MSGVKVTYEVVGLNQDRLLEELRKRDFILYNVKKPSNRVMHISVNLEQSKNFFAITENLCYNVKRIGLFGKGLPLYKLVKNLGLVLGALVFFVLAIISNDYILDFSYSGSGAVYYRQVSSYLEDRGINRLTRFSSLDIERLEDEILADNENLTFVSVRKNGNTLAVYMTLKSSDVSVVGGKQTELRAQLDGVIESVKVYRGTAVVEVGDSVKKGDLLVEGYALIKEQRVETGVLACITLLCESSYNYLLEGKGKEDIALSLASEEQPSREIASSSVTTKKASGQKYIYTVRVTYRAVIYSE